MWDRTHERTEELNHWESRLAEDPDCRDGYGRGIVEWLRESKAADQDLIGFWGWPAATQSHGEPAAPAWAAIGEHPLTVLTEPAGTGDGRSTGRDHPGLTEGAVMPDGGQFGSISDQGCESRGPVHKGMPVIQFESLALGFGVEQGRDRCLGNDLAADATVAAIALFEMRTGGR